MKRSLRELQLIVSMGAAMLIFYAVVASAVAMRLSLPEVSSRFWALILGALLSHGTLLVIAPVLCFAICQLVDLNPWRLGLGSVAVVEGALLLLRWVTGGFDASGLDASVVLQVAVTVLAGVLASLAARLATRRVRAREAAVAPGPGPDLAEQMRQAQQAAGTPDPPTKSAD